MPSPTTSLVRRALLVHAHPEQASFSSAQADAAVTALRTADVRVDRIDLYADGWDPVLRREQFPDATGYFKPQAEQLRAYGAGTLDETVREHLDRLLEADLLVLSFPLWWFSMPAVMKGWVDRVFAMGATFGGEHGIFAEGAMRGKQAVLLLTTGGGEPAFGPSDPEAYGALDAFLFHIRRGMLEFVGYEVLEPVVTYAPARMPSDQRDAALRDVQTRLGALVGG
ncbi:hypothetical protein GCM10022197_32850 [Microlunatus spumicola]|uniref:Flavodoxin-like fold domain-containing protein n=1 Tax=Microlunatus spumicola TaxID=81499 RepID=A0ABP6XXN5_9ACTN